MRVWELAVEVHTRTISSIYYECSLVDELQYNCNTVINRLLQNTIVQLHDQKKPYELVCAQNAHTHPHGVYAATAVHRTHVVLATIAGLALTETPLDAVPSVHVA